MELIIYSALTFFGVIIGYLICNHDTKKAKAKYLEIIKIQRVSIKDHIKRNKELLSIALGYKVDLESVRSEAYRQSKEIKSLTKQLRKPIEVVE